MSLVDKLIETPIFNGIDELNTALIKPIAKPAPEIVKHSTPYGATCWRLKTKNPAIVGLLHREDGPAIIRPDGSEEWLQYGKRHRVGGPAITDTDNSEYWYYNGQLHRINGPAITQHEYDEFSPDYTYTWFLYDKRISSDSEYQALTGLSDEDMLFLVLKFGHVR